MAVTAVIAKNRQSALKKWTKSIGQTDTKASRLLAGKNVWVSTADAPSGAAWTGLETGDFILHVGSAGTTRDAYIYEGGTTYTKVNGA